MVRETLLTFFLALACAVAQYHHPYGHGYYHPGAYYGRHYAGGHPGVYRAPVAHAALIDETPKPYAFSYEAPAIGGASARQESADGSGRVVGSYSLNDEDGRSRVVEYIADDTGFHASVQTNEPGTADQSPADVALRSNAAPTVYAPAAPVHRAVASVAPYRAHAAPYAGLGHYAGYGGLGYPGGYHGGYYGGYGRGYGHPYNYGGHYGASRYHNIY